LKIGDRFRQRIDEAIRLHDKLLVILSANSVQSDWVREEVESCLEREWREKPSGDTSKPASRGHFKTGQLKA